MHASRHIRWEDRWAERGALRETLEAALPIAFGRLAEQAEAALGDTCAEHPELAFLEWARRVPLKTIGQLPWNAGRKCGQLAECGFGREGRAELHRGSGDLSEFG